MIRGAEDTRTALMDALVRLLARGSVAGLSVRHIAAEAGVNHGLVHRHFGSKEELVRATIARLSARVHAEQAAGGGMSASSFEGLRQRPEVALVVARACLDGPHDLLALAAPPPERIRELTAPMRRALGKLGFAREGDAAVLNALGTAALLGWIGPIQAAVLHLGPDILVFLNSVKLLSISLDAPRASTQSDAK